MSLLEVIQALHLADVSLLLERGVRFKAPRGGFPKHLRREAKRWKPLLQWLLEDCESRTCLDARPPSSWKPFDGVSQADWEALEERIGILHHDAGFPLPWATVITGAAMGLVTDVVTPSKSLGGAA